MATPMTQVATDYELGDQIITVQHETILMTVGDSTIVDQISTTVAEFEDGATAAVLPEIIHMLGFIPTAVAVDTSGAMPIIDVGVSSDPICNIGDTTKPMDTAAGQPAGHEPGVLAREINGQPGALDLGFPLAAVDTHGPVLLIDVQVLSAQLLPRRDNIRGELPGADVEGIFSITLSREYRRVDVELGWGIVVGELSRDDFNEILAFPACFE